MCSSDLGKILTEHEAVSAQACEDTDLRVNDVTRFGVTTSPASEETDFAQVGNPLGEDLRNDFQKLLAVVLDVLACLVCISVGAGTADDLASVCPLLSVYSAEALVVAAVDDHIERASIGSHHGQTARNESLMFNLYAGYIMQNTGLDEAQVVIKIAGRNINNLRHVDDTTLIAESEENIKGLLKTVIEESEKVGLKLNIQKTKIMASGPIISFYTSGM